MTCRCHASSLYAGLVDCPKCRHRSFDAYTWMVRAPTEPLEGSCERRACGYEGPLHPRPAQGTLFQPGRQTPSPTLKEPPP